jgi:hypothetical protein
LLIATDRGVAPAAEEFNVKFIHQPVLAGPGVECYPDQPDCPVVRDFTEGSSLFEGIEVLALNRSGWLQAPEIVPGRSTSARLPEGVTFAGQPVDGQPVVYGAAEGPRGGRFLFAADHSIFINETMLNENDEPLNASFANNVVDWLIAGRETESLKVLFLEDGKAIEEWIDPRYLTGDWPTSTFQEKMKALEDLLRIGNAFIRDQQSQRDPHTGLTRYNQAVRNWESRQRPGSFLKAALWGVAAFLALTTLAWLLGRRRRPLQHQPTAAAADGKPTPPPPYGPKSEDDPAHRSLLDRRRVEMLEEGHYVDLARRLSRVWMTQQLGSPPSGAPVDLPGLRRTNRHLLQRWRQAWTLATDASHPAMSLRDFQKFRADLAALQSRIEAVRQHNLGWMPHIQKENA